MKNIKQLRSSLAENYEMMKAKEMDLKQGKELANTAGKILSTISVELKYQQINGEKKKIEFLEY
jgi:hypothetical protein